MENVINISILADSVSPSGAISAGVQGDDKTTVLNVSVDEAVLPTVSDTQSLRVLAEAVNGAGEYYVTEFLEMVDNIITFPLPEVAVRQQFILFLWCLMQTAVRLAQNIQAR